MARQWIRLDVGYMTDGKLARAGWEATLLWPAVVGRIKERGGVCDAEDLEPALLQRLTGAPLDLLERAIDALAEVELLVWGTYRAAGGKGGFTEIEGIVIPGWRRFNPEDGATTTIRRWNRCFGNGRSADVEQFSGGGPDASDRCPENAGRDGTGRDGTEIPPNPPRGSVKERRKISAAEQQRRQDAETILSHWFELADRSIEPRGNARKKLIEALSTHLEDHALQDVLTLVDYLALDPWWRGQQDGQSTDLFSKKPLSWMRKTKSAEFEARVVQALEWSQQQSASSGPVGVQGWLELEGNAEWLLRTRDRADSYQQELSPSSLCDAAAADDVRMDPELAVGLLRWLETR